MAGSAAVVLAVFEQIAALNSIDTRDSIENVLGEPPFDGLGMTADDVLGLVRVLSMIAGACATATAILGWQVLQRSRPARIALSILAVPLFVTGFGTGAILSTAVAAAVGVLWLRPARDWFDGTWKPEPPVTAQSGREVERDREQPARPQGQWPAQQPTPPPAQPQQPPPYAGWPAPPGQAVPPLGPWPGSPSAPPQAPAQTPAQTQARTSLPSRTRPRAVLAAVVLTWVCSLLLGGLFVAGAVWLIASPDRLMDEMARQNPELMRDDNVTVGLLRGMVAVMAGGVLLWVLAACVLALLVLRGKGWARVLLLVSTAVAGLGLLIGTVLNQAMLVPLIAAVAVFALLLRRDVSAWFSGR
ncbi:hypothetical protein SAMN04487968_102194 [Nocardioides terrae]|uniref:Uncharacterized protein n=2 Tax=Nocardioides terrae TaxID=574651 RepID=A0A1I1EQW4_9ACTN|nr:hypothetical protein SAMN04487968_102194 [Nocardioides terrae]